MSEKDFCMAQSVINFVLQRRLRKLCANPAFLIECTHNPLMEGYMYLSGWDEKKKIDFPSDKLLPKFTCIEQAYQPSFSPTLSQRMKLTCQATCY